VVLLAFLLVGEVEEEDLHPQALEAEEAAVVVVAL